MPAASSNPPLNLLQRVDLLLADRLAAAAPEADALTRGRGLPDLPNAERCEWIAGLLAIRGLLIRPEDVRTVIEGGAAPYAPSHHEYRLIMGMSRVYDRIVDTDESRPAPEGWNLVELFKEFTKGVARFRNNILRRDMPWDAVLFVNYPDCESVPACLDDFHPANSYTDVAMRFDNLHPVRQAFRVMWLFARIAPFPDFNLTMAWVAMNRYLLHMGYPMIVPRREDRERMHRMLSGPVPVKIVAFESRLLEILETQRAQ